MKHGRVDGNQTAIVEALRRVGCSVQPISDLGHGIPDLLVYAPRIDAHLLFEIDLGEHLAHQIALLDAHAMFTREHAADRNAETQTVKAQLFGAFDVAFLR